MSCPFKGVADYHRKYVDGKAPWREEIKGNNLDLYTFINLSPKDENPFPQDVLINEIALPVKSSPYRGWYEKSLKTHDHAKYCMPIAMANSLGYILRSPITFSVSWSGDEKDEVIVNIINKNKEVHAVSTHSVSTHSAPGSFTLQYRFVMGTSQEYFTYIKGIANIRSRFNVMEALLESWWFEGTFGVVCLLNQPCDFIIKEGDPIASVMLVHKDSINFAVNIKKFTNKSFPNHKIWDWWQEVKGYFYDAIQDKKEKFKILNFFKKYKKKLMFNEDPIITPWGKYQRALHDFDYARGLHALENIKPKERAHFTPKDLFNKEYKLESITIDDYNTCVENEKENKES